jgi:hypothetical protein
MNTHDVLPEISQKENSRGIDCTRIEGRVQQPDFVTRVMNLHISRTPEENSAVKNVPAEWLAFLLRNHEVMGSNLSSKTGYTEFFRDFPRFLQTDVGLQLFSESFPLNYSLIVRSFDTRISY